MLTYRIIVKNNAGTILGDVFPIKDLKFNKKLNSYGEASFKISATNTYASTLISLRSNYIEIWRNELLDFEYLLLEDGGYLLQENGDGIILEQSGSYWLRVWSGEQVLLDADLRDNGSDWVEIHCFGWFETLFHRCTSAYVEYIGTDQGLIAWGLINTANSDESTGISQGTIPTTKNRDRHYYNQNIGEAITNLSGVLSGFDFEITDDRVFNVYSVKGEDKTGSVVFEYGRNIKNVKIIHDFTKPTTRAIVLGEATGETTLQRVERNDLALQASYGLRESVLQEMDVSGLTTLEDKGDAMILKYGQKLIQISFDLVGNTFSINNFDVGDLIRLRIKHGIFNIDTDYRVFQWEVVADSNGSERVALTLGTFTI